MAKKRLREGFTTGSAAAAGAKAALLYLSGRKDLKQVVIPLPVGGRLTIPVDHIEALESGARATVIKDAGDDPDVTHKAKIRSTVHFVPNRKQGEIDIDGGKGVGRVTKPGLPVPVGEPAINPVPRQQIREAVQEGLDEAGIEGFVSVIIDVVDGEKIAKKTFNPRLGILGGISILGTRGTVKPFSNEAYRDTITVSMDVARAGGLDVIALAAALCAVLHALAVLTRGLLEQTGLVEVMAAGLFHIHMLARHDGGQCHGRMPVVGRSDADRVNGLVLEQLAEVHVGLSVL